MTEFTKLEMESVAGHVYGIEKTGNQKISVFSEQIISTNSFQQQQQHNKKENTDSFVLDIENLSSQAVDRNTIQNSRIQLQRNLSRKGYNREKKPNSNGTPTTNERDNTNTNIVATSSPRAPLVGVNRPDSSVIVVTGTSDLPSSNTQAQHQITVTAGNGNISSSNAESKYAFRRNSFKRPSSSWTIDPRRVLFFFATFSSMGTIMLIYLTLTMRKHEGNQDGFQ